MKVYIDSDDRELGIAVANLLNRSQNMNAIIAESDIEGYDDLVEEAKENANKGFDYVLVLSSNPYKASIDINKASYTRAVPCRTRTDVDAACKTANANVIVLDSTKGRAQIVELVEEFSDVSFGGVSGATVKESEYEEQKSPSQVQKAVKGILSSLHKNAHDNDEEEIVPKKKTRKKKEAEPEYEYEKEDEDEEEEGSQRGKKGFLGGIKDALGIE